MLCTKRLGPSIRRSLCFVFVLTVLLDTAHPSAQEDSEEPLTAGREAFDRQEFRQALKHFRAAAKEYPADIDAQRWLGYMAAVMGEAEEALRAYQEVARLKPSPRNSYWLGKFAGDIGETAIAAEALRNSLSYSWRHRIVKVVKAFYGESDPEDITEIVEAWPNRVAQYLFRVLLEAEDRPGALSLARSRGWVRDGMDYCKRPFWLRISDETAALLAMLIHPERAGCALQVGKDLTENADYRLARFVLMDLVRNSKSPEIREKAEVFIRHRLPSHDIDKRTEWLNLMGTMLDIRHDLLDEAIEVLQKAVAADPKFAQPHYRIGIAYRQKKNYREAMNWHRKALAIQPDHWRATYSIGWLLLNQDKNREALPYFQKAVELNPRDENSFYLLGCTLSDLGRYEEALAAYRKAVALNPNDAYNHWGVSWALKKLGRQEEAKKEWEMALKINPKLLKEK